MRLLLTTFLLLALSSFAVLEASPLPAEDLSPYVLKSINTFPKAMGYDSSQEALNRLAHNVSVHERDFVINFNQIGSNFCSGATYLVFLKTLNLLKEDGLLDLDQKTLNRLANLEVHDGEDLFGRWNANGPGAATLFKELQCGINFTSYKQARPGDFMKIWWTQEIGVKEKGHSVIFLGKKDQFITYWSANTPKGYGKKTVPVSRIQNVLFSRLTTPENLERAAQLPYCNDVLKRMLTEVFTWQDVRKACLE